MKNAIAIVVAVLVGLGIGYQLYPMLNPPAPVSQIEMTDSAQHKVPAPDQASATDQSDSAENHRLATPTAAAAVTHTAAREPIGQPGSDDKPTSDSNQQQQNSGTATSPSSAAAVNHSPASTPAKSAYQADDYTREATNLWVTQHKKELDSLIDTNLPGDAGQQLKQAVSTNNLMLDDKRINQPEQQDELWSQNTQQQLTDIISQSQYAGGIQLVGVTCKQLMCEIIVIQNNNNSWFKLLKDIYPKLINDLGIVPGPNDKYKSVMRFQGDQSYIYFQLGFKPRQ